MIPAFYVRAEARTSALARAMVARFVEEIPLYASLPREQLSGEIAALCRLNLGLFFLTLREGRLPTEAELAEPRLSSARRAEERVPLAAVLTAYHIGGQIGWESLVEEAGPDDVATLIAAATAVQRYVQTVTGAVAEAYLSEQQAIHGEERETRRALVRAVLSGEPAQELAARLDVQIAPAYVVVALAIEPHPDELELGVGPTIAARRKVRRIEDVVADSGLLHLDGQGGALLLATDDDPTAGAAVLARLPATITRMSKAAGAPIAAGAAWGAGPSAVASAHAQAREVLRLARLLGRGPGLTVLDDVLLEYQLSRPSDALATLAGLLDPLKRSADLLATLQSYTDLDADRRLTATALRVHPNTLDYRLRRISELTGQSVTTPKGLQTLTAALAAALLARTDRVRDR
jgi:sugar diacid utilization regulator